MSALRRVSTRRLLAVCALTVAAAIGITAGALATTGGGPEPAPKPLAKAVQDALQAPALPGISARIQFTNHLVAASGVEGADPLLAGASGRLWASPAEGGKLRIELQTETGGGGDSQVLVSGRHFEIYDGSSRTVYRGTMPRERGEDSGQQGWPPGLGEIEAKISKVEAHADVSGAIPSDVAGQPTYTVRLAPKHDGGLLAGIELAWDAGNGTPLRGAVYAKGESAPVLQLQATEVSYEAVPASVFEAGPPPGARVVELTPGEAAEGAGPGGEVVGEAAVRESVPFALAAPESLAGMPRSEVRGVEVEGRDAALIGYGKGLGGILVVESASEPGNGDGSGLEGLGLPKVQIGGVQGEELETPLGTVIRFSRGGVDYVVAGSVPAAVAEEAAAGL
ncbi:MAG: LolA family protein [Syntrophothermus sp.]